MRRLFSLPSHRLQPERAGVRFVGALRSAALWLGLLLLGTHSARAGEPDNRPEGYFTPFGDAPAAAQRWFARWEAGGESGEGRPIETMQIGRGPFRTLVLGSLHGSEAMAVEATARLARHLGRMSDHWHEFNVLLVKTPNPDGHARRINANSRGVDLNRNFPTAANVRGGDSRGALTPFSEAETIALRQLIETFRPHRIVHVKSTRNAIGWALCNDKAQAAAGSLKQFRNLRVGRLENRTLPGSVESYATGVLRIEAITLAVPHEPDPATVWRNYRTALLAATAFVDPQWQSGPDHRRFATSPAATPSHPQNESFRRRIISELFREPGQLPRRRLSR